MKVFVVTDRTIYTPILNWLREKSWVELSSQDNVSVFDKDDSRFVLADTTRFSLVELSNCIGMACRGASRINVIAPSMIQYFASGMAKTHPIFSAINKLSNYAVCLENAPVFRMTEVESGSKKYDVSFASFPKAASDTRVTYISNDAKEITEKQLGLVGGVVSTAAPLIFYHTALQKQFFVRESIVDPPKSDDYGFERLAYNELMLGFPSRDAKVPSTANGYYDELQSVANSLDINKEDAEKIWHHNRKSWGVVCEKLGILGITVPQPSYEVEGEPSFNQFTHLVVSGFLRLVPRLDLELPPIRHIGLPMFARNGVTIALGKDGIVERIEDVADPISEIVAKLLPQVVNASFAKNDKQLQLA